MIPRSLPVFGVLFLIFLSTCELPPIGNGAENEEAELRFVPIPLDYPQPFQDTTIRDTFGRKIVTDPFRWLESAADPALKTWIRDQRMLCDTYFTQLPFRDAIHERLVSFAAHERWGIPEKHGDYYYLWYQSNSHQAMGLFRMADLKDSLSFVLDRERVGLSRGQEFSSYSFSAEGHFIALEIADPSTSARRIVVWDTQAERLLADQLAGVQYSQIAWFENGFFYSRYLGQRSVEDAVEQPLFHQLFYHRLGTSQSQDELVYADRRHPRRMVKADIDASGRWLILSTAEPGQGNALLFRDLQDDDPSFIPVVEHLEDDFTFVGRAGQTLLLQTTNDAPRGRMIRVSMQQPEAAYWEEVIPEKADVLYAVHPVDSHWIAHYGHNGSSELRLLNFRGEEVRRLSLPDLGTVTGLRKGNFPDELFYGFSSFTQPETIYRLQLDDYSTSIVRKPPLPLYAAAFITKQVWYESYDGTEVPLFVIHKRDIRLDGNHPVLLLAHPGQGRIMSPAWNQTNQHLVAAFLENGGICATAAIRGGGELGKEWVEAGRLDRQQQAFDDFQAAAEYLITNRYTKREKLAIYGEGTGGLVVGACLVQRPDLFRVAVLKNALLDMLRYPHFKHGWEWRSSFGSVADSLYRDGLLSYSPLHNVEPLAYPATLLMIDDNNQTIAPAHSRKFAAAMQAANTGSSPVLFRRSVREEAPGHLRRSAAVDVLSFLLYNLKEPWSVQ